MMRRNLLMGLAAMTGFPALAARDESAQYEVTRTEAEWQEMLSDREYEVMRKMGTERAYTSPLLNEKRAGTYACKGCDLPLYSSETKFDSGTGWPSFYEALPGAIGTQEDRTLLFLVRTECHCARCGSHLGHIFDDGPPPTGKRHCINGVSLTFVPEGSASG
jgi:peptide-methionine (R)-S-oxide reductase